jgi:transposase
LDDFPPCSPDLNPVENILAVLKREIGKKEPKNLQQQKKATKNVGAHTAKYHTSHNSEVERIVLKIHKI